MKDKIASLVSRVTPCLAGGIAALIAFTTLPGHAAGVVTTATWGANSGSWNLGTNWSSTPDFPSGVGASAIFESNQTAKRTVTLGENITVGSLFINNSTAFTNEISVLGATTPVLTFDEAGSGPATLRVTGNATTANATPNNLFGEVFLNDPLLISVEGTSSTSAAGTLTLRQGRITGPGGITKQGPGTLTFADNAKEFEGALVVDEGRLRFNATALVTKTSGVTVNAGGQLALDGTANYTFGGSASKVLTLNGSGLAAFPGAIRSETNRVTTIENFLTLQSDVAINVVGAAGSLTLTNTLGGPGMLTVGALPGDAANSGKLILSGDNAYTGGTTLTLGSLVMSGAMADLGAGDVTVEGTAVSFTIQSGVLNAIADSALLSLNGGGTPGVADAGVAMLGENVNETVGDLLLGGVPQVPGTYGSSQSNATFRNDEYFNGPGILTVVPEPSTVLALCGGLSGLLGLQRFRRKM